MSARLVTGQESLWTAGEVKLQAEQVRGQLDVWDVLKECLATPAAPCDRPARYEARELEHVEESGAANAPYWPLCEEHAAAWRAEGDYQISTSGTILR